MPKNKSFTMIELLIVIIIIGILAAVAIPNYVTTREKALDREAKATLAIIQAAEKIYRMEQGFYYPYSGSTSSISNINTDLKISLPLSAPNWTYSVSGTAGTATRSGRTWTINPSGSSETPTCSGTCY